MLRLSYRPYARYTRAHHLNVSCGITKKAAVLWAESTQGCVLSVPRLAAGVDVTDVSTGSRISRCRPEAPDFPLDKFPGCCPGICRSQKQSLGLVSRRPARPPQKPPRSSVEYSTATGCLFFHHHERHSRRSARAPAPSARHFGGSPPAGWTPAGHRRGRECRM